MNTRYQTYAQAHTRKEGYYAGFLFLIWPFLAAVSAFRNYNKPWAKNIFWAFCAFYGYVFAIGAESQGSDILAYIADYQNTHQDQFTFAQALQYFRESGEIDILRTIISIGLSRFTDAPSALTLVYGIIFGYFFSRNIWFLLERMEGKIAFATLLILACFFLVNPIWKINGFRMWTAVHVFLYGLLPYLFDGKKNGLWIAALSILVHFSFIVPVGALVGYLVAGNRLTLYFGFYLFTLFAAELDISAFNEAMTAYAPEILQERTSSYRSEAVIEARGNRANTRNWYVVWNGRALTYAIMGFIVILFVKGRGYIRENIGWHSLFSFTLLFYGVANILSALPSGGRFMTIAHLCALAVIALYVQNRPGEKVMNRFIYLATPALLLYIVVEFRVSLLSMSASVIMGNPLLAILSTGDHISLNDVLKMIL
jgi:hypothetical protein